jgi:hypothetical protein
MSPSSAVEALEAIEIDKIACRQYAAKLPSYLAGRHEAFRKVGFEKGGHGRKPEHRNHPLSCDISQQLSFFRYFCEQGEQAMQKQFRILALLVVTAMLLGVVAGCAAPVAAPAGEQPAAGEAAAPAAGEKVKVDM